ncbi:peptidoglycan DD-metalloendopeptidase family protein [Flavobacteriaceae bacterium GSB9]|nr:peptidoglycan DD-metalloendopeptidase family protein [Flavobacteriaceae bacterium GSB9]
MSNKKFIGVLRDITDGGLCILDTSIQIAEYIPIDLSETNEALKKIDVSSSVKLAEYVNCHILKHNSKVAYGGYLEERTIYKRSTHFNQQDEGSKRNIHLGIDLWCLAETKVLAVLEGEVHSFKNNTNHGDYGPTIILKHQIDGVEFFTLYGHLSLVSIENIKPGYIFKKGEKIGVLGDSEINGDYPPHLHFQIIKDLQGYEGDYPGVCSKNNLAFYKANCPDPNLLLKI